MKTVVKGERKGGRRKGEREEEGEREVSQACDRSAGEAEAFGSLGTYSQVAEFQAKEIS